MFEWFQKKSRTRAQLRQVAQVASLIDELEETMLHGTVQRRVEALQRVTDLFVARAPSYSEDLVAVFDSVCEYLTREIETSAKIALSERLAPIPNAPPQTIRRLAFDPEIRVAAPVLTHSQRLKDADLIANALTRGQAHMMAIARRDKLSPAVTDVLIEHGDRDVIHHTAANHGAKFSDNGYHHLVERAHGDDDLTHCICNRNDVPRHLFLRLLARASDHAREHLESMNFASKKDVEDAINAVASQKQAVTAITSALAQEARQRVELMHRHDQLDEAQLMSFIKEQDFEAIAAALAHMVDLPVEVAETLLIEDSSEGLFVIAKAINLSWPTVAAMLEMRSKWSGQDTNLELAMSKASYERLKRNTAQQVLRFYRMRQEVGALAT